MTVTIDLVPDVECRLSAQAAEHGLPIENYIQHVLKRLVASDELDFGMMTPEEKSKLWDEWINKEAITGSTFLDDSRESIYGERENSQYKHTFITSWERRHLVRKLDDNQA
jgi:hypothetical protein